MQLFNLFIIGHLIIISNCYVINTYIYKNTVITSVILFWSLSQKQMCFTFVTEGVQGVDHELEDAVPHQWVVQRGTAAFSL